MTNTEQHSEMNKKFNNKSMNTAFLSSIFLSAKMEGENRRNKKKGKLRV